MSVNIHWSEATVQSELCSVFPKKLSTKANKWSLHWLSHRTQQGSAEDDLLKTELLGLEAYENAKNIILFSHLAFLLQPGWEVFLVPPSTSEARKCFGQHDLCSRFQTAAGPQYGSVHQCYGVIWFSTSVGKCYFRNSSELPEILL